MRIVYLGSPEPAVPPLRALVAAGHDVLLVVTQPDRKRGRGAALVPAPVKSAALSLGVPVADHPDAVLGAVARGAELGVVVAYGRLIKPHLLAALPFVNLHFSLLPRWRGAAPVERAILAGDARTGVCLMQLEEGLDTGPVYRTEETGIGPEETADELRRRLVAVGTGMLIDALATPLTEWPAPTPQAGEPTYAAKLEPGEHELHWDRSAAELQRVVRLGAAYTTRGGRRLKVLSVRAVPPAEPSVEPPVEPGDDPRGGHTNATPGRVDLSGRGVSVWAGDGRLQLLAVQPEGKAPMAAEAWRNGAQLVAGELLGA